jgi:hypothetical protein
VKAIYVRGRLLERIAPGIYSDGQGTMHLVCDELLEAHGYADTPENRAELLAAARELLAQQHPPVIIEVFD